MNNIDNFLNKITMYRLLLYGLLLIAGVSIILGFTGVIPYKGSSLLASLLVLIPVCFVSNLILGKIFKAIINSESSIITALILYFIFFPPELFLDYTTLFLAGFIAMLSKFALTVNKKHIFNPVAFSAFILGAIGSSSVFWWAGSKELLPFFIIFGFLIIRKIRKPFLFFSFITTSLISITLFGIINGLEPLETLTTALLSFPLIFFGTIMLTEPMTTPPTTKLQLIYGGIVGLLFGAQFHVGPIYSSPELALLIGNIYSFIVSPKDKLFLIFKERMQIAKETYEYTFVKHSKFKFLPGQYMEWTVPGIKGDGRGNRRYFTIASSPTEDDVKLGIRFNSPSSSFKKLLSSMEKGELVVANQLNGEFILPKDKNAKIVFIAGGIGITPMRSMIKYLIDKKQKKDIILFYSIKSPDEIAYQELLESAEREIGIKVNYMLTGKDIPFKNPRGKVGRITNEIILKEVPDYKDRIFYLSGPDLMVRGYKKLLLEMGVKRGNIKTDYFPGF